MSYEDFEFEDVGSAGTTYVKYRDKETQELQYKKGDVIVTGRYIGFYVDETFGNKKFKFDTGDGTTVLPGAAALENQLELVREGEVVQVIYGGLGDKKVKGNYPHFFRVRRAKGGSKPQKVEVQEDNIPF